MSNLPKYLTTTGIVKSKNKSKKQEKSIAKQVGGSLVANSGSGRAKGDVNTDFFKIEIKYTDNKFIKLNYDWLNKIEEEAFSDGRYPALYFDILGAEWVCIRKQEFLTFLNYLREDKYGK